MKRIITLTVFLFCLTALFAQSAEKELEFYRQQISSTDKKQLSALEWDLNTWLNKNYTLPTAPEAMVIKAQTEYNNRQYVSAYLTILKYVYEHPTKKLPKDLLTKVINEFPSKQQADMLEATAPKNLPQLTEDRLNMYFSAANKLNLKNSQDHLLKDYAQFFMRFPAYENNDKIELLLGDLYRNNGNYWAALSKYDKVWQIYPSTKYRAAALRMKGDIYASELKDYKLAREHYKRVLSDFPNSVEVPTVYKHWALLEESDRNYDTAVENAQKSYEGYLKDGQKVEAFNALMFKAEVQEKDLKNYNAAIETLKVAAEIMPNQEQYYVAAKEREAKIQADKLKDNYSERTVREEIATHFPTTENGVQALYRAAELAEKFGDTEKAKNQYKQVILNRPQSKAAVKAQKRITKIEKAALKSAKDIEKQQTKPSKEPVVSATK